MEDINQENITVSQDNVEFIVNGEVVDQKATEEQPVEPAAEETADTAEPQAAPEPEPQAEETETPLDLSQLEEAVKGLQDRFDQKIAVDEHKNKLFDKLYDELQLYKQDVHAKLVEPVVKDVIKLLSEIQKFCDTIDRRSPDDVKEYLAGIPEDLTVMLEDHDVEMYRDLETETFNPRTQRVLKIVPTDDAELEKKIAERVRPGYRWKGKTLQPELVNIYKKQ